MKKSFLILSLFIFTVNAQFDQQKFEKTMIESFGEKKFNTINQNCITLLGESWFEVTRAWTFMNTDFDHLFFHDDCDTCLTEIDIENWKEAETKIKKIWPDFHEKPNLKIKRFQIFCMLPHFDLDKDLKKHPDLLTNFDKFIPRLYEKLGHPLFRIKALQNKDGSWGSKNKLECTSMILLSYFSAGETETSKYFGNDIKAAIKYIQKNSSSATGKSRLYSLWFAAEGYAMTALSSLEEELENSLPEFTNKLINPANFENKSELFILQSMILKGCSIAGIPLKIHKDHIKSLRSLKSRSPAALMVKILWGENIDLSEQEFKTILKECFAKETSPLTNFAGYYIALQTSKKNFARAEKIWNKKALMQKPFSFSNDYSKAEKEILNTAWKSFISNYKNHYFPTSREAEELPLK